MIESGDNSLSEYLRSFTFQEHDNPLLFPDERISTKIEYFNNDNMNIPKYINEFWTFKQRKASSIHEISYRACFKPQLPRFFIDLLSNQNDVIFDPFSGRGTTMIEAGLLNRNIISNDINPISKILSKPRFFIPSIKEVEERLHSIDLRNENRADIDLSMFYHKDTESEIVSLKGYLLERREEGTEDTIDDWIRMIATNRLTGHSSGFFSVYTLPPNQAVSQESQIKINKKRDQKPLYRDVKKIIIKKTRSTLRNISTNDRQNLRSAGEKALFTEHDARNIPEIGDETVDLSVTSPPFLNIVQYSKDNWLRCWFNSINSEDIDKKITMSSNVDRWSTVMADVFEEYFRIIKPKGWIAFEVGEVKRKKILLDEYIVPLGIKAGFECKGILINEQEFTKTSNIWGINNNHSGTNTNRIVIFQKL
ncbi:MAG: DNA methyltransferase [Candidatus Thermoplasmatota archaeon]|nr:DNA methyltransferase [Candidatus Thermoplasmatota archaeon]